MRKSNEVKSGDSELIVRGRVLTGVGKGEFFVSLPWFRGYVKNKLGFEPFPGTLNLKLTSDTAKKLMGILNNRPGYIVPPEEGYFPGRLYRALIASKIVGAIVKPEAPGYPEDIIEVIAPVNLRETLNLRDGDEVEVKIFFE